MKYIAVFCSASEVSEKYVAPAREFGRLLAGHGYHLVWGGSDTGLMKVISEEVQAGGGKLFGVSLDIFSSIAKKSADEMIVAKDLGERKSIMLGKAEAIVVLVGGLGTLDEVAQILELKKLGIHNKPIVFLNTENFYEGIRVQLQKMNDDGFVNKKVEDLVHFGDTPQAVIEYIDDVLKG